MIQNKIIEEWNDSPLFIKICGILSIILITFLIIFVAWSMSCGVEVTRHSIIHEIISECMESEI